MRVKWKPVDRNYSFFFAHLDTTALARGTTRLGLALPATLLLGDRFLRPRRGRGGGGWLLRRGRQLRHLVGDESEWVVRLRFRECRDDIGELALNAMLSEVRRVTGRHRGRRQWVLSRTRQRLSCPAKAGWQRCRRRRGRPHQAVMIRPAGRRRWLGRGNLTYNKSRYSTSSSTHETERAT